MTPSQLKENFNTATKFITRDGIEDLITWLTTETDFFTAPASTNFHGNYETGLLEHSLTVVRFALHNFNLMKNFKPELEYLRESVVISSLFHDVCKVNTYIKQKKWTKDENDKWKQYDGWIVEDKFPLPHGPKSVYLISKFIKLTDAEALAIAWHMGESDLKQPGSISSYAYANAWEHPLVKLIMAADMLATSLEEKIDLKTS